MMQRSSILCNLTSDEIHVAQVLLDITSLIRSGSDLKWGSKKRRSRLKNDVLLEQSTSPVTPLSFCPAESDDHHLLTKKPKRMSRREYMEMIEELSQRRDLLRGEIEEVNIYYNKLVAQNSQLKAMKQELQLLNYSCPGKQEVETSMVGNGAMENETHLHSFGFGPIPDLNMDPNEALDRRARFAEARRKRKDIISLKSFKFPRTR